MNKLLFILIPAFIFLTSCAEEKSFKDEAAVIDATQFDNTKTSNSTEEQMDEAIEGYTADFNYYNDLVNAKIENLTSEEANEAEKERLDKLENIKNNIAEYLNRLNKTSIDDWEMVESELEKSLKETKNQWKQINN